MQTTRPLAPLARPARALPTPSPTAGFQRFTQWLPVWPSTSRNAPSPSPSSASAGPATGRPWSPSPSTAPGPPALERAAAGLIDTPPTASGTATASGPATTPRCIAPARMSGAPAPSTSTPPAAPTGPPLCGRQLGRARRPAAASQPAGLVPAARRPAVLPRSSQLPAGRPVPHEVRTAGRVGLAARPAHVRKTGTWPSSTAPLRCQRGASAGPPEADSRASTS